MKQNIKKNITILFILFFVSQNLFGKDTSSLITTKWHTLKSELSVRTDIAAQFTKIIAYNSVDTGFSRQLETSIFSLNKLLKSLDKPDSTIITLIHDKNDSLSTMIKKGVDICMQDKKIVSTSQFADIMMQLEGNQNRIFIAIREFNETCKSINRKDLVFNMFKN